MSGAPVSPLSLTSSIQACKLSTDSPFTGHEWWIIQIIQQPNINGVLPSCEFYKNQNMTASSLSIPWVALSLLAAIIMSRTSVQGRVHVRTTRHYAGLLPPGYDVTLFLQICQICGQFYGMDYSSNCVHDKTFMTFSLCLSSVENR